MQNNDGNVNQNVRHQQQIHHHAQEQQYRGQDVVGTGSPPNHEPENDEGADSEVRGSRGHLQTNLGRHSSDGGNLNNNNNTISNNNNNNIMPPGGGNKPPYPSPTGGSGGSIPSSGNNIQQQHHSTSSSASGAKQHEQQRLSHEQVWLESSFGFNSFCRQFFFQVFFCDKRS